MKQNNYLTYYQLLGIDVKATTEQIITAYREKMLKYHPDKNHDSEVSNRMVQLLNDAKDWLTDPVKRKQYDQLIGVAPRPEPPPKVVYRDRIHRVNTNKSDGGALIAAGVVGLLVGVLLSND